MSIILSEHDEVHKRILFRESVDFTGQYRYQHRSFYQCATSYQLVRKFQLRAELIKITPFERAQNTEQEYQIFSKTYAQVPSKIFLK